MERFFDMRMILWLGLLFFLFVAWERSGAYGELQELRVARDLIAFSVGSTGTEYLSAPASTPIVSYALFGAFGCGLGLVGTRKRGKHARTQ